MEEVTKRLVDIMKKGNTKIVISKRIINRKRDAFPEYNGGHNDN